ncbi:hypothetical protein L3V83_02335 [Thiotrichales bacterium 19X7-9]|nr:hypothetical protein [Thiotrichales bacterium 19X7-9]
MNTCLVIGFRSLYFSIAIASDNTKSTCVINLIQLSEKGHFTSAGEIMFTQASAFNSAPIESMTCTKHSATIHTMYMFGFMGSSYRVTTPECNVKIPKGYQLIVTAYMTNFRPNPQPKCYLIHYSS